MALAPIDTPLALTTTPDVDKTLQTELPLLLFVSNGETPRADVRTEMEKTAKDYAGRIQVARIDTAGAPEVAERFEMGKQSVLIAWVRGGVIARRNRPWGTDVAGMVEVLLPYAPAAPVAEAKPTIEKVDNKPVHVTDATFEQDVLKSTLPVLVDFWAAWCGPCRQIAPTLEKLAAEFAGKIRIAKVDVDANPGVAQAFRISSIPNLMFVKNGKIVGQQAGALPENVLRNAIQQLIALQV